METFTSTGTATSLGTTTGTNFRISSTYYPDHGIGVIATPNTVSFSNAIILHNQHQNKLCKIK